MDIKGRIARAREQLQETEPQVAPVEIGGELVDLTFRAVAGHVWADLTAACPPRHGSTLDENVGFNSDAVARMYPLDHVLVDGEALLVVDEKTGATSYDVETWNEMFDVLPSPSIKLVAAALWGLNENDPAKRIAALGKARAGASTKKRRSRANSESPSAD